ncbi:MAG: ABC transporter ATP-binding protein [Solidesulfovibrio sp.]|uniref:ABC transporter ATP-binding protein n=1 Tax=Solidesulfovibrio sp. TaxID=2910990 RepID=UPI003157FB4B
MLTIEGLSKTYAANGHAPACALAEVSFAVPRGGFVSLLGPSGCGKSTLLLCASGLLAPTAGRVTVSGRAVTGPPPEMALIFQNAAASLFPWLTVAGNIRFVLRRKPGSPTDKADTAAKALAEVGLSAFADHYPWQLSGGMQQRAALARGLAYGADVLLLDEPFASVDAQTREDLEDLLARVAAEQGKTVLFVTHDIDEAVYLSDTVVVLTPPPARVAATLAIDLPRPRDQVATREDRRFLDARKAIHALLRR